MALSLPHSFAGAAQQAQAACICLLPAGSGRERAARRAARRAAAACAGEQLPGGGPERVAVGRGWHCCFCFCFVLLYFQMGPAMWQHGAQRAREQLLHFATPTAPAPFGALQRTCGHQSVADRQPPTAPSPLWLPDPSPTSFSPPPWSTTDLGHWRGWCLREGPDAGPGRPPLRRARCGPLLGRRPLPLRLQQLRQGGAGLGQGWGGLIALFE